MEARIRDLEGALCQNNLELAVTFQLTPALANILGLLISLPLVSGETIEHRLELSPSPKVAVHRLRRALSQWQGILELGDEPLIKGRRCVGYWIEPEHKEKLRQLIATR